MCCTKPLVINYGHVYVLMFMHKFELDDQSVTRINFHKLLADVDPVKDNIGWISGLAYVDWDTGI